MTSCFTNSHGIESGSCLAEITWNRPICAGVLILYQGRFLLALGTLDRWEANSEGTFIPVTGIGGGQEPREDLAACAKREAHEELGCLVDLLHSKATFVETPDEPLKVKHFDDDPAPLLFQVQKRTTSSPFAPGLPAGDRLHIGIFRAMLKKHPRPADIPALLHVPPYALATLCRGIKLSMLSSIGIDIECSVTLPDDTVLFIPQESTERMLSDVISKFSLDAIEDRP